MASNMRTSQAGLDVIKTFEGFRPRYQKLSKGFWIGGYGHVTREPSDGDMSKAEAETVLREYDLPPYERLVQDSVLAPLNQTEFDALVSFAFNIGAKSFIRSNVVSELNAGNRMKAAAALDDWDQARIGGSVQTVDALVRRRSMEKALFLRPPANMPSAASRLYRAQNSSTSLTAPIKPREIIVENAPSLEAPERTQVSRDEEGLSPTQAAAAAVRRQMVRILGEEDRGNETEERNANPVASPDEITAAVSELVAAGEEQKEPVTKSVWPVHQSLGDDLSSDEVKVGSTTRNVTIDDLEAVEVSQADIDRALAENAAMMREGDQSRWPGILFSWMLALFGLGLIATGLVAYAINESGHTSVSVVYAAPVMIFIGWLILSVMGFQAYRSSLDED